MDYYTSRYFTIIKKLIDKKLKVKLSDFIIISG